MQRKRNKCDSKMQRQILDHEIKVDRNDTSIFNFTAVPSSTELHSDG